VWCCKYSMDIHWTFVSLFPLVWNKIMGIPIGWLEGMRPSLISCWTCWEHRQWPASEWEEKVWIATPIEKDRLEDGHAVLTAKIYCTFVCFVDLFQSILMYGGQRLQLKDTSREGAVGRAVALVCVYGGSVSAL
jgi:hypothetical protein